MVIFSIFWYIFLIIMCGYLLHINFNLNASIINYGLCHIFCSHLVFKRNRIKKMSNDYFGGRKKISFFDSVVSLIGHLLGSAILFLSFYAIGWIISFVVHWLNLIHKVPPDIAIFTAKIELWIVYADAVLCFFVISAGAYRFIRDLGDMRWHRLF